MSSLENQYPGNSRQEKTKKSPPKLEKVVTNKAIEKPTSVGSRLKSTFSAESTSAVMDYLLFDVVIPNTKSLIMDMLTQGVERKMYGDGSGGRRNTHSRTAPGYTAYNRAYKSNNDRGDISRRNLSHTAKANHDFGEIVLETRGEAEIVIDTMTERIQDYDVVTVYDLYELVDITGDFTDNKYGWTDARGFRIKRVRNGYLLDLPRPIEID